jgi:hypothetical protein
MTPERVLVELIRLLTEEGLVVRISGRGVVTQLLQDASEALLLLGNDPYPEESPGPVPSPPAGA